MSKTYDLLVEKIQNTILAKLNEDVAQQAPMPAAPQQPVQAPAAPQQPAVQPAQTVPQEVSGDPNATNGGEQQGVDEVGMSESQEMSGQLAQMLRDFKATQEDGGVEACKFAAGMVVAAAIDGLDYKDRKDILKKIKAGEFNSSSEEGEVQEEQPVEEVPTEQPQVAETLISRRDDREDRDLRMADKKKDKKLRKSSPFSSPVQEAVYSVDLDTASKDGSAETAVAQQLDDPDNTGKTVSAYSTIAQKKNPGSIGKRITYTRDEMSKAITNAQTDGTTSIIDGTEIAESYIMTKKQLEQVRLHEMSFSKGELEESFKK